MFGLTRREQRWAAEQKAAETASGVLVAALNAKAAEALAGHAARDAQIATQEAQIKVLQSDANSWQSGYDEGRHIGAKHCIGTIDQLRAELASLKADLDHYETTAENCDLLRDELAAIKAQEPVATVTIQHFRQDPRMENIDFQPVVNLPQGTHKLYAAAVQQVSVQGGLELIKRMQVCLSLDDTEWGLSAPEKYKLLGDIKSYVLAAPAPSAVVMPAVPDGYKLVPIVPTPKMVDATWDHAIDTYGGVESQNSRNMRIYKAMLAASPAAKRGE